jgi:16S rRNA (cytosine967-C5)-methyltransferase
MSELGKNKNSGQKRSIKVGKTGSRQQGPAPVSAREAALKVLAKLRGSCRNAHEVIEEVISDQSTSGSDRDLATELIMGVIRHRLTLICVLGSFAPRGWKKIDRRVQNILMLAAFQVIWLDAVPDFAAVNEAVDQAKRRCGPPAGRFVNAILRQMIREIEDRRLFSQHADLSKAIPLGGDKYCQFHREIFADPAGESVQYLAYATSHPPWLVSRWYKTFGWRRTEQICLAGTYRPVVFLRPNRLRTDSVTLAKRLQAEGYTIKPTEEGDALAVEKGSPVSQSAAFAEGLFQPQDPTAMNPVRNMNPQAGETVIDLCAGLGTKSSQMAEMMGNRGTILACDKDASKLEACQRNCARLGIHIVRSVELSELESAVETLERIDWILVDVPCSNTGVLARRPEARYRVNQQSLKQLSEMQFGLLVNAEQMAGAGTRLCYSTCSVEPEENEQITTQFARAFPYWELADSGRTFPQGSADPARRHDGGYWAIWVRK